MADYDRLRWKELFSARILSRVLKQSYFTLKMKRNGWDEGNRIKWS